ncbi:ribosomal RNA small subunit methyltransferase H-like [Zingiber officinale]|uniref:ribosomal RNA small subunit methyltransferase H-like n=1 Tax=Zingiber officinale TaxID=94328 RepID=UPI001C4C98BE|nr:ribosomal RNA small subunit methyltransferase H-like [Zingiber officinale]
MDMDASIHDQARAQIEKLLAADSRGSKLKAYTHVRNFKYIKSMLGGVDENLLDVGVNGILMDLGISSMQCWQKEENKLFFQSYRSQHHKGFSVQGDGPLDMRMNPQVRVQIGSLLSARAIRVQSRTAVQKLAFYYDWLANSSKLARNNITPFHVKS